MQQQLISLRAMGLSAIALGVAACGNNENTERSEPQTSAPPSETAEEPSAVNSSSNNSVSASTVVELDPSCDRAAAERAMTQCKVCHSISEGAPNLTGPNLFGVYGREAATLEGFAYSPTLKKSGIVWDDESLDGFLENPPRYLPGNRMAFGGVKNETARAALICYLKALQ